MDNRHIHIKKMIDTLVIPKVNDLLMEFKAPLILGVEVDDIHPMGDRFGPVNISIRVHYKDQQDGELFYFEISFISYPIAHMITTCIDYVITDNYRVSIINILMDTNDSATYTFDKEDSRFPVNYAMKELKDRLSVGW